MEYIIVILLILILYAIDKGKTITKFIAFLYKTRYWTLTYAVIAGIFVGFVFFFEDIVYGLSFIFGFFLSFF